MDWLEEVRGKLKRKNKVFFSKQSELLQDLLWMIEEQNRKVVILWALDLAEETVQELEKKYPQETRARKALESTKLWAEGHIKMPVAKKDILQCHAVAKELTSLEDIALYHAVGQACSVVHTVGHASGYPIYELTTIVRKYGIDNCKEAVEKRKSEYVDKLLYWIEHVDMEERTWASFITK